MKYIYCLLVLLTSTTVSGQNKPISLTINGIKDTSANKEVYKIHGEVFVFKGNTIQFDSVTYESEFVCNMGSIGLDFEKLEDNCYGPIRPDCDPLLPYVKKPFIQINGNSTYTFDYDISSNFTLKILSSGKITLYGCYRFRIIFRYKYDGKPLTEKSEWQYLSFK